MNAKQCAKIIKIGLRKAGIDFVATLPDEKVVELIKTVKRDSAITHIQLSREEEGIGICAGAYLTGKRCALIIQNGGLLNSCNALTSTSLMFEIPVLLLVYYAGDIGDRGFTTVGSVTGWRFGGASGPPVRAVRSFTTWVVSTYSKSATDSRSAGSAVGPDRLLDAADVERLRSSASWISCPR